MNIFNSEQEFLETIEKYNQIINDCVEEKITFQEFLDKYDDFYGYYALDGHESDLDEQQMFKKYESKINVHLEVWENILTRICSDEDAVKESYLRANRFGSKEGLQRLKEISQKYSLC